MNPPVRTRKRKHCVVDGIEKEKKACAGPRKVIENFGLEMFVSLLRDDKNILVISGAGISVSCGIPDFRSSNGLYKMIEEMDLDLPQPECLLHLDFFQDDPVPYYRVAKKLLVPSGTLPSDTHRFIALLEKKRKLLRNYTQNIDGLEKTAGVKRCVQCHGTLAKSTCLKCKKKYTAAEVKVLKGDQEVPFCGKCQGLLKPDIVMFGENIPSSVKRAIERDTAAEIGCVVVIGTSLQVAPVSHMVKAFPPEVPQVLINRDLVSPLPSLSDGFDLNLIGNCDVVIRYLCKKLGWSLSSSQTLQNMREHRIEDPSFQQPNIYLFEGANSNGKDLCTGFAPEIVTCDICKRNIPEDEDIMCCQGCFDYDLCLSCYNSNNNSHSLQTKHKFKIQERSLI